LIVISKFNELLKVERTVTEELKDAAARLAIANQHSREIAKALQWIVDNEAERSQQDAGVRH